MSKRILVIGGTGTMGRPLVEQLLEDTDNEVWVVGRHLKQRDISNQHLLAGNAFNISFLRENVLCRHYDAIVDFLWYDEDIFSKSIQMLLNATEQYISLSSAAVYVESKDVIDESTLRDYDVASENERRNCRDYNFVKARLENILKDTGRKNWTIIRPHLTFNSNRIPLCSWEINIWLQRAIHYLPIAIPVDLLCYKTTFTHGSYLAHQIINLIGCEKALGETFQLGSETVYSWGEIVNVINEILEELRYPLKIFPTEAKIIAEKCPWNANSLIHNRMRDLCFSTNKYRKATGDDVKFVEFHNHLQNSIKIAVDKYVGNRIARTDVIVIYEHDKIVEQPTPYSCFTFTGRILYFLLRIGIPSILLKIFMRPKNVINKIARIIFVRT